MIEVEVTFSNRLISTLCVAGHAEKGIRGRDIVCAAVSVLTENLTAGLRVLLGAEVALEEDEGYYKIGLLGCKNMADADLLFSSALLGLKGLQKKYPEIIVFNKRGD